MKLLNITDHHKQLRPIIKAINSTPQLNTFLCADIVERIDRTITQYNLVKTKQDLSDFLQNSLDNIFDFMNYPSINDMNSYINHYFEDFEAIQGSELYYLDDGDLQDLSDMYDAGIKTVLAQFISILEYYNK